MLSVPRTRYNTHGTPVCNRGVSRAHIPLLLRAQVLLAAALRHVHDAVDIALCSRQPLSGEADGRCAPMACLYSPYSRNRVADGGFCEPVRILFTVLSAWLKTRSGSVRPCNQSSWACPTYLQSQTWRAITMPACGATTSRPQLIHTVEQVETQTDVESRDQKEVNQKVRTKKIVNQKSQDTTQSRYRVLPPSREKCMMSSPKRRRTPILDTEAKNMHGVGGFASPRLNARDCCRLALGCGDVRGYCHMSPPSTTSHDKKNCQFF